MGFFNIGHRRCLSPEEINKKRPKKVQSKGLDLRLSFLSLSPSISFISIGNFVNHASDNGQRP